MRTQASTVDERAPQAGEACQLRAFPGQLETGPPGRDEPWLWYLQRRLRGAHWKARLLLRRLRGRATQPAQVATVFPALALAAGDRVRVRPADEIRSSLDDQGGIRGCAFAPGMFEYCEREFRVARVVNRFFDEARWRMLRARSMVLLEGVHCDGASLAETRGCDRMCFYFWRTEWLEKVEEAAVRLAPGR